MIFCQNIEEISYIGRHQSDMKERNIDQTILLFLLEKIVDISMTYR